MASGDVAFQAVNMPVLADSSELSGATPTQTTKFGPGTSLISGANIDGTTGLSVRLFRSPASPLPETLFDSTKLYKITIEEV